MALTINIDVCSQVLEHFLQLEQPMLFAHRQKYLPLAEHRKKIPIKA